MGSSSFSSFNLQGLFYKKEPVSPGPSGTYYGSLVVINHRRVSTSTQCLPRVSNSHSLTVSSAVAFLSICPLLPVAPTWTLRNWSFSCWRVFCFYIYNFFSVFQFSRRCVFRFFLFFFCVALKNRKRRRSMEKILRKPFAEVPSLFRFHSVLTGVAVS